MESVLSNDHHKLRSLARFCMLTFVGMAQGHPGRFTFPTYGLTLIWHYAQQPKEEVIWELEQFMAHIWPTLEAVPVSIKAAA